VPSGMKPGISPIRPATALASLLRHVWVRFGSTPRDVARDFTQLSRVARTTPVRLAEPPQGLGRIHELSDAIREDVRALAMDS
jgi:hypothetical protein